MFAPLTDVSVYKDDSLLLRKTLPPGEYVIGHDVAADISFSAEGVAARHAKLRLRANEWAVEDLEGGTFVNDKPITGSHPVFPDQRIRLGQATISLHPLKTGEGPLDTLAPQAAVVRELLPQEIRSGKKYEIGEVIGRGGMGVVLNAREGPVGRNVAMKLMQNATRRDEVERFVREAQITAQLEHPNIVPVHELDVNELEQPFFTMKYVRGVSLGDVLEQLANGGAPDTRKSSIDSLLTAFQKVCDAIAFAHSKRIIHRDLKPDNIMLGEYGEVLVMDWGLAKVLGSESNPEVERQITDGGASESAGNGASTATQAGIVMGTLQYMPPEQASGYVRALDEKGDIYALGAILHHILTLRPPVEGHSRQEVRENVCNGRIRGFEVSGAAHLPGGRVPDSLRAVVRKAMAFDPSNRYANVRALQADIAAYQTGFATTAESASAWKLAGLFLRRHRVISTAAALLLIVGFIFTVSLALARNKARAAQLFAMKQRDATENHLYVSDMVQAGRDIAEDRSENARDLLDRHRIEPSGRDLRGWEWFLLDAELNQDRLRTYAHSGGVYGLAVSADGRLLATGGADGEIAIWRTAGLAPQFRLRGGHQGTVFCIAWQTAGHLLASGGSDGKVCIWDIQSQREVGEIRPGIGAEVRTLAWRPLNDGSEAIAFGGLAKEVYLWRPLAASPPPPPEELFSTENGASSLHWSQDGVRLAAAKLDAKENVVIFDMKSRSIVLADRPTAGSDVLAVAINPPGELLAAGSKHGAVIVFDTRNREPISEKIFHRGFVRCLAWSPDGTKLASAGNDRTICISQPSGGSEIRQILRGHVGEVLTLAWARIRGADDSTSEQTAIFSGGADGTLRAWRPDGVEHAGFSGKGGNWIATAQWDREGKRVAMVNFRERMHIIDRVSGLSVPLHLPPRPLFDVAWSPGGDRIACARRDPGLVELIETATGRPTGRCEWPKTERIVWSSSGNYLLATGAAGTCTWDVRTGLTITKIDHAGGCAAWHADDRHVAIGSPDGSIEIWDAINGARSAHWRDPQPPPAGSLPLIHEPPTKVNDVQWSPNGRFLAFATMDKSAGLLDARDGRLVRLFPGHTGGVYRVRWSPDGSRLATCGQDGIISVFDPVTGDLVTRINHGSALEVRAADWSHDGRQLVTGGDDQFVRIWDSSRSIELAAVQAMHARIEDQPADAAALINFALRCAQIGLCDWTREALARARESTPADALLPEVTAQAEALLAHSLEAFSNTSSSRALDLLNAILYNLDSNETAAAVDAFRRLAEDEKCADYLHFARNYFTRANWTATWFPCDVDPREDLIKWRALTGGNRSVTEAAQFLDFSYPSRSADAITLSPSSFRRTGIAEPFGMIARSQINLSTGKWCLHARGRDGIRIIVNGKPLLEHWTGEMEIDDTCEWEQLLSGSVDIIVEHFALTVGSNLQVFLEPALAAPKGAAH